MAKLKTPVERQKIRETVANVSAYDFDGSIKSAIEMLQNLLKFHGEEARLDYGEHYAYDDSKSFNVVVDRLETDQEYEQRVSMFERTKRTRIEQLEAELARLKGQS